MKILIILLLLSSCASNRLGSNLRDEVHKICLSGSGKGRLHVGGHKYVFAYESELESEKGKWSLSLDFPMRNPELLEINWDDKGNSTFHTSIDQKIIRENSEVNPDELDSFIKGLGDLMQDIVKIKQTIKGAREITWSLGRKALEAKTENAKGESLEATFSNSKGKYFGRMDMQYSSVASKSYRMEFIVRKCFEE